MSTKRRPLGLWLAAALFAAGCGDKPSEDDGATPDNSAKPDVLRLDGIDIDALTPRERREWSSQVGEMLAPCPSVPVNLAQCIQENRDCAACKPAAEFLLKQVQAGIPKQTREELYKARFDPSMVKEVNVEGSPTYGPAGAVVTIVEWADFECPACRALSPILHQQVDRFEGQVRMVYKFYPLKAKHPNGEIAARAGIAAYQQEKFWDMHDLLFKNQGRLARSDVDRLADALGLDMTKYKSALTSDETTKLLERDMEQAEKLGLEGTPFVFVNGRELLFGDERDIEEWIKLDIQMAGQEPNIKELPKKDDAGGDDKDAGDDDAGDKDAGSKDDGAEEASDDDAKPAGGDAAPDDAAQPKDAGKKPS